MRVFALYDSSKRQRKPCAWVLFEPASESFSIELADWSRPNDVPLGLAAYAQLLSAEGKPRIVDHYLAWQWLETRIPPASRKNIGEVLDAHGLEEYYAPTLLTRTKGRSLDDDFLLEEVSSRDYKNVALAKELESPEEFGIALGRARRAANLTQHQLSEITGIPQPYICSLEKGHGNPTLETLELLAAGCGRKLRLSLE